MRSSVSSKTMASGTLANSPSRRAVCRLSMSREMTALLRAFPTAEIVAQSMENCLRVTDGGGIGTVEAYQDAQTAFVPSTAHGEAIRELWSRTLPSLGTYECPGDSSLK